MRCSPEVRAGTSAQGAARCPMKEAAANSSAPRAPAGCPSTLTAHLPSATSLSRALHVLRRDSRIKSIHPDAQVKSMPSWALHSHWLPPSPSEFSGIKSWLGFPGGSVGKASACDAGDLGSIPGSGRCPGEGNGNPLQYSCLWNPMDRRAWWATVQAVTKDSRHDLVMKQHYHSSIHTCVFIYLFKIF